MNKVWILKDEDDIVRCVVSDEPNLHKDKLHMKKEHVEFDGIVGDKHKDGKWEKHPENYPKETDEKVREQKKARLQWLYARERVNTAVKDDNTEVREEINAIEKELKSVLKDGIIEGR